VGLLPLGASDDCYTDVGDTMVTETSLQPLPDPESIVDEVTASDALHSTLAAVATASHKLANAPKEAQIGGDHRNQQPPPQVLISDLLSADLKNVNCQSMLAII
jgi:hypothetical protein